MILIEEPLMLHLDCPFLLVLTWRAHKCHKCKKKNFCFVHAVSAVVLQKMLINLLFSDGLPYDENSCSHIEGQFEIPTESHDGEMPYLDATGPGMVCSVSHHGNGAAIITIDAGPRQSFDLVLDANYNSVLSSFRKKIVNSEGIALASL